MDIFKSVRKRFSFSDLELDIYLNTAPFRYKTYKIDKRNGGKREISQPSRDLKILQRFILDHFLNDRLVIHDVATAYRRKRNIADNVRAHVDNPYLLKMDFKDFFPSIRTEDFEQYVLSNNICSSEIESKRLGKVFFKHTPRGNVLSIGSPGSPLISNALLYDFDQAVYDATAPSGIVYTRYSDDLAFSTKKKDILFDFPSKIESILKNIAFPRLSINHDKTVFSSKKFNRHITGITISNEGSLSLGHLTKRILRSRVHAAGELNELEKSQLRGYLSFVSQVEPDFLEKIKHRYPEQMKLICSANSKKKGNTSSVSASDLAP